MGKDDKLIYTLNQKRNKGKKDKEFKRFSEEWNEIEKYCSNKDESKTKRIIKIVDKREKPVVFHKSENTVLDENKKYDEKLIKKLNENIKKEDSNTFNKITFNKIIDNTKKVEEKSDVLNKILDLLEEISEKLDLINDYVIKE